MTTAHNTVYKLLEMKPYNYSRKFIDARFAEEVVQMTSLMPNIGTLKKRNLLMEIGAVLTLGNAHYSTRNLGAFMEKLLLLSISI